MKFKKIKAVLVSAAVVLSAFPVFTVNAQDQFSYKDVIFSCDDLNGTDVIKGVDVSSVISLENSGVVFKNEKGEKQDIFLTLKNAGVNYIRVRVWNDPWNSQGQTYGGGGNDVDTAVKIAQRCSQYGLKLLIDFHYSDFWADPGKQIAPKAWKYYSVDQKEKAIKDFTDSSLRKIASAGAEIGMVQIGNETNTGMAGETDWQNICRLMNSASSAVRNFDRNILVAVHFTNPEKQNWHMTLAGYLNKYNVDYDVFATSYYPYWHGTLNNLTNVLRQVSSSYGKYVMVAETSWANTFTDYDRYPNTIGSTEQLGNYVSYDVSVQGQINELTDVFSAVSAAGEKGIGAFYWEPAWLAVGSNTQECSPLWEKYGSGWASKAAGEYQEDAAKYYGGSSVDNQALFSQDGKPLASLDVFSHIKSSVSSENKNILKNPGFEADGKYTDVPSGWKLLNTTSGEYSKFTVNDEMPMSGTSSVHWYSPDPFTDSSVSASVTAHKSGNYEFSFYAAGEKSTCTAEIYVNGIMTGSSYGMVSAYDIWENIIYRFRASAGDKIDIVIKVSGSAGSYGSVDNCALNFEGNDPDQNVQQPEELKGDIDGEGTVQINDLVKLKNYMLGITELEKDEFKRADINDDGILNIADYILLSEILLK